MRTVLDSLDKLVLLIGFDVFNRTIDLCAPCEIFIPHIACVRPSRRPMNSAARLSPPPLSSLNTNHTKPKRILVRRLGRQTNDGAAPPVRVQFEEDAFRPIEGSPSSISIIISLFHIALLISNTFATFSLYIALSVVHSVTFINSLY